MDLKNTINNTNKQKENIKTVANNIDNKLVELGGEKAINLSDVPNKMQKMLDNYKGKIAIIKPSFRLDFETGTSASYTVPLRIGFTPTLTIVEFTKVTTERHKTITIYSDLNNTSATMNGDGNFKAYIEYVDTAFLGLETECKDRIDYKINRIICLE